MMIPDRNVTFDHRSMHAAPNALAAVLDGQPARLAPECAKAGIVDRAGLRACDARGAAKIIVDDLDIGPAKLASDRGGIDAPEWRLGRHRDRFHATPLIITAPIRAS
jgi:hypothetical protein